MNQGPTHSSVTDIHCTCGYLERSANDPSLPIDFDERSGEYQFRYEEPGSCGPAMLVIYHCPFCGGAAPASKRSLLFHVVSREEQQRLVDLLMPLRTVADVVQALGAPDYDRPSGECIGSEEAEGVPPLTEICRTLQYSKLSKTADATVSVRPNGSLGFSISGKPRQLGAGTAP